MIAGLVAHESVHNGPKVYTQSVINVTLAGVDAGFGLAGASSGVVIAGWFGHSRGDAAEHL